ncbi:MAG: DUF5692 family protein [Mycoplasmatales bacterium]
MIFFEPISFKVVLMALFILFMLVFVNEITRRNKYLSIFFYILIPIFLTIFVWPTTASEQSLFAWVKTYSALAGVICFMYIRYKDGNVKKWVLVLPALILGVNILEAVIVDFKSFSVVNDVIDGVLVIGGPWNILNAIAGIISIITITGWFGIVISKKKSKDMIWPDLSIYWIVAYSIWNFAYCLNCISDRAFYAAFLPIVSCSIAVVFFRKGAWLQHRAQTLALWAMTTITIPAFAATSEFAVKSLNNETTLLILSIVSLLANLGVLIFEIYTVRKYKRNIFKDELYVECKFYKENLDDNGLLKVK